MKQSFDPLTVYRNKQHVATINRLSTITKLLKSKQTSYFIIFLKPANVNLIDIVKLVSIVKLSDPSLNTALQYSITQFPWAFPVHHSCTKRFTD